MRTYAAPIRAIPITVTSGMIVLIAISPVEGDEGVVFASPVVLPALLPLSADGVSGVDGVPGVDGGCGYDVCDLESRWKMIILQLATCSRSRLKNSRLVYQTVGGYFCVL